MHDSMAHPRPGFVPLDVPGWKTAVSWVSALLLAVLFVASGVWKITDAPAWAVRVAEMKVPESISLAAALGFGIAETMAGVLIFVPRFRRWGAILTGVLLLAFLTYFTVNYNVLRGQDCSCFPWVKRVVGPGFFIGDALMLLLALLAGLWAQRPGGLRGAVIVLSAAAVFALVCYGAVAVRQTGTKAPETVLVNGQPFSLQHGKVFLFFFDPECMHCFDAAKKMAPLQWGATQVVAVPIQAPQYAGGFLQDTGLRAVVSSDLQKLKQTFSYAGVPAGVALENGREKEPVTKFEGAEPAATLKRIGFVN